MKPIELSDPATIDKPNFAIEALAKHVSDCSCGSFRLATLDGIIFEIIGDKGPCYRGSFAQVAKHCGFVP